MCACVTSQSPNQRYEKKEESKATRNKDGERCVVRIKGQEAKREKKKCEFCQYIQKNTYWLCNKK